jgi:transposase-like protein
MCKLLLVTDELGSCGSAFRHPRLTCPHHWGLRKNNRTENSHQVVKRPERKMQRFKSSRSAQLSQYPFHCPQYLQLSKTSRFSVDASDLQGRRNRSVASGGCGPYENIVNLAHSFRFVRNRDNTF